MELLSSFTRVARRARSWGRPLVRRGVALFVVVSVLITPIPAGAAEIADLLLIGRVFLPAEAQEVADAQPRAEAQNVKLASIQGGSALMNPAPPVTTEGPRRTSRGRWTVPVGAQFRVLATGFSSTRDQTDSSPFDTASGTRVHDGTAATNFLPFGTKIRFLNYRPDKIFIVEDRHHPRLSDRIDIWFTSRGAALNFGKRVLQMEVIE